MGRRGQSYEISGPHHGAKLSIVLNTAKALDIGDDVLVHQHLAGTAQRNGHIAGD
jgi:hypothetical protein